MTNEELIKKLSEIENPLPMSDELFNLMDYIGNKLAKELPTLTIDLDYFILGVFSQKNSILYKRLNESLTSSTTDAIYTSYYQVVSSKALSAIKNGRKAYIDDTFADIFIKAVDEANTLNSKTVGSDHVFLSILNHDDNKTKKLFNKAGITYNIYKNKIENENKEISTDLSETSDNKKVQNNKPKIKIISNIGNEEEAKQILKGMLFSEGIEDFENMGIFDHGDLPGMTRLKKGKDAHIKAYCTNLNDLAEQGKIDSLVGRDKEVNEIIRILGRKKKNNAILLGGEGVGKTAIGESIAHKIVHNNVPDFLSKRILVSLDMTALMAGTTLRGMFEERVKGILDEIKANPNYILFMDNIGAILADKGKNDFEISAMLSRALENGEVQVIGTSDFASYRKTFDKDPSLARRFQKIIVETPSIEESINILYGLRPSYEDFHKVSYEDEAIEACVHLADRYISERNLPDSAIDILDEIGSMKGTIIEPIELGDLREEIKILDAKIKALSKANDFEQADFYSRELKNVQKNYNTVKKNFEKEREDNPPIITKDDILEIISIKTNIPVNNLSSDDKKKLTNMNDRIKENVIGQDEAINTICKALKRNRIGLNRGKCMYSSIMIGKTGCGKCVSKDTMIKVRNKKTGEIQVLTINDFKNLVSS